MFAKMIVAAVLVSTAGVALASDASYDQQRIRTGSVTLVEGALKATPKADAGRTGAPATAHDCSCERSHA
jgi:hypothetical protein